MPTWTIKQLLFQPRMFCAILTLLHSYMHCVYGFRTATQFFSAGKWTEYVYIESKLFYGL